MIEKNGGGNMSNGILTINDILSETENISMDGGDCNWSDSNGAYHEEGWNDSWSDGYHG